MQDAGSKEDTHLKRVDLIVSWSHLCVESVGRCQYAGKHPTIRIYSSTDSDGITI
jgi:hypothetical protein